MEKQGKLSMNQFVFLVVVLVLMGVGTIFDFAITDALNGQLYYFGRFFELFGELPIGLGLLIGCSYFATTNIKNISKPVSVIGLLVSATVGVLAGFVTFYKSAMYMFPEGGNSHGAVGPIMAVVVGVLAILAVFLLITYFSKKNDDELKALKFKMIGLILFWIFVTLGTEITKSIWARPRYWAIVKYPEEIIYQPWYVIAGMPAVIPEGLSSNAFKSFPSGHTANAFGMLSITLCFSKAKNPKSYNIALYFALIWGTCTGLSRLLVGQHFLTDVTVGGLLAIGSFYLIKFLLRLEKKELKEIADEEVAETVEIEEVTEVTEATEVIGEEVGDDVEASGTTDSNDVVGEEVEGEDLNPAVE